MDRGWKMAWTRDSDKPWKYYNRYRKKYYIVFREYMIYKKDETKEGGIY